MEQDVLKAATEQKAPMNIQIFVSHRIDLDAEQIDNPLYVPVRCGAIYDGRRNVSMLGDDTGDNISEKRLSFCEFTVQYWAWKNVDADYYGLCHYRRYLSFADKREKRTNAHRMIESFQITDAAKRRFGLLDEKAMADRILAHDVLIAEPGNVTVIPTYTGERASNERELWQAHEGLFIAENTQDTLIALIHRMAPDYLDAARAYFASDQHIGYNCFVMKKACFERLCAFQFPILFEMEKLMNAQTAAKYPRLIGYAGEVLYGIFIHQLMLEGKVKIGYQQMVFFADAKKVGSLLEQRLGIAGYTAWRAAKFAANMLLPQGTRKRMKVKALYSKTKDWRKRR